MGIEVGNTFCTLRSELWLKRKKVKRKVSGKPAAAAINIAAADVRIAGRKTTRQFDEVSDTSFIKGLRSFNSSFLY
jgi:hypothetical protein